MLLFRYTVKVKIPWEVKLLLSSERSSQRLPTCWRRLAKTKGWGDGVTPLPRSLCVWLFGIGSIFQNYYTVLGERVVPRLCELGPRGQRESGCGIHAT